MLYLDQPFFTQLPEGWLPFVLKVMRIFISPIGQMDPTNRLLELELSRLMLMQGKKRCQKELRLGPYFELELQWRRLQLQLLDQLLGPLLELLLQLVQLEQVPLQRQEEQILFMAMEFHLQQ